MSAQVRDRGPAGRSAVARGALQWLSSDIDRSQNAATERSSSQKGRKGRGRPGPVCDRPANSMRRRIRQGIRDTPRCGGWRSATSCCPVRKAHRTANINRAGLAGTRAVDDRRAVVGFHTRLHQCSSSSALHLLPAQELLASDHRSTAVRCDIRGEAHWFAVFVLRARVHPVEAACACNRASVVRRPRESAAGGTRLRAGQSAVSGGFWDGRTRPG